MTFAFAPIGAVVSRITMQTESAGGSACTMPAHHNLEAYLDAYIEAAGIRDDGKAPSSAPPPAAPVC
jgi:hypothetical protein